MAGRRESARDGVAGRLDRLPGVDQTGTGAVGFPGVAKGRGGLFQNFLDPPGGQLRGGGEHKGRDPADHGAAEGIAADAAVGGDVVVQGKYLDFHKKTNTSRQITIFFKPIIMPF